MKDIKTRTERLSDERHSPVFQQQFGGELGQHELKQSDHFHHKRLKGSITVGGSFQGYPTRHTLYLTH